MPTTVHIDVTARSISRFDQRLRSVQLGLRLLNLKNIPVGDLLPALVVAPILIEVVAALR